MDTLDTLYCRQVSRVPFAGSIVTNGTNDVNWDKRSKKLNKHTLHILAPWQPWPSSLSLQRWSPWCFAQATAFYLNRIGLYLPLVRLQIERWCCRWFDPSTSLINLILSRFRKCFMFFLLISFLWWIPSSGIFCWIFEWQNFQELPSFIQVRSPLSWVGNWHLSVEPCCGATSFSNSLGAVRRCRGHKPSGYDWLHHHCLIWPDFSENFRECKLVWSESQKQGWTGLILWVIDAP